MRNNILLLVLVLSFNLSARVTIYNYVNGYSINDGELIKFRAIAFENGEVLGLGNGNKLKITYPKARVIDGHNSTMLPGLTDSKTNLFQTIIRSELVDLSQEKTLLDIQKKLKKYINRTPGKFWIEAYGWNQSIWPKGTYPTKEDLDVLGVKNAIYIRGNKGVIAWANSRAIKVARANKIKNNPPKGRIIFNKKNNHTGIYIGSAVNIIKKEIPKIPASLLIDKIIDKLNYYATFGLTTINETQLIAKAIKFYKILAKANRLPIRVNGAVLSFEKTIKSIIAEGPHHFENQLFHMHTVKYIIDGNLSSKQALMEKPYINSKSKGVSLQKYRNIIKNATQLASKGWQIILEAQGDLANKLALKILSNQTIKSEVKRNTIEYAKLLNPKQLKDNQLAVSIQPYSAVMELDILEDNIGKQRTKKAHQWRSITEKNVRLVSGSNYPLQQVSPFLGIQALVTGKVEDSNHTIDNSQTLSVQQAFATYTINAAYANQQEDSLGSLEVGKWADFILIDQDIFTINPNKIGNTKVIQTWVAGKKVYDNPNIQLKPKKKKTIIFKSSLEK